MEKNNITELVFILDKSGSMAGLENDTIGGFNAMIEKQKKTEGKTYVSTVLFSNNSQVIHDRKDLFDIAPLNNNDYIVGGGTALIDAIGGAVHHIKNIHKYARPEDVPNHTIFVITTDGMENSSTHYTSDEIKQLIKKQTEESHWEFLFVAANIDAVETGAKYGFDMSRVANYDVRHGTGVLFKEMSDTICRFRKTGNIRQDWATNIENTAKKPEPNNKTNNK